MQDLGTVYQMQIGSNDMYTLGADFGETIADVSQLNPDQLNNRTIAENIATYSRITEVR